MIDPKLSTSPQSAKHILHAAHSLLQPPDPIPKDPIELRDRIEKSVRILPLQPNERIEIPTVKHEDDNQEDASKASEAFGIRALELLLLLQKVLVKEYWPASARPGYEPRDSDLRLVRSLITHSLSLLSVQSETYVLTHRSTSEQPESAQAQGKENSTSQLTTTLTALLPLLRLPSQPPSPGPSEPRRLPPTTITQLLLAKNLPLIFTVSILVGYNPLYPPAVHADIRKSFLETLSLLPPAQCIAGLSAVIPLCYPPTTVYPDAASSVKAGSKSARYPEYTATIAQRQLSAQISRPGGVPGLLFNLFGERARSDAEAVDEKKVEVAVNLLSRVPANTKPALYVKHVMRECMEMLSLPREGQGRAPRVFRVVAGGFVQRLTEKWEEARESLARALQPVQRGLGDVQGEEEVDERLEALELLDMLIAYTDPAYLPSLMTRFVQPLLPSLTEIEQGSSQSTERMEEIAADTLQTWKSIMERERPCGDPTSSTGPPVTRLLGGEPRQEQETHDDSQEDDGRSLAGLALSHSDDRADTTTTISHENQRIQDRFDRAESLISQTDPPSTVEGVNIMTDLASASECPEELVPKAVTLIIGAVRDDEPFVHLKAISCAVDLAVNHGAEVVRSLSREYIVCLQELKNASEDHAQAEGRVLRIAEGLDGVLRVVRSTSTSSADVSEVDGVLMQLESRLREVIDDETLLDTIRASAKTLLDQL